MDPPWLPGKELHPHPTAAETGNYFQGQAGRLLTKPTELLMFRAPARPLLRVVKSRVQFLYVCMKPAIDLL